MVKRFISHIALLLLLTASVQIWGQDNSISGVISDQDTNTPLEYVLVFIRGEAIESSELSEADGSFKFENLSPGNYTLVFYNLGFENDTLKTKLTPENPNIFISQTMEAIPFSLKEINVVAKPFTQNMTTPLSSKSLGQVEIQKNPGSGNDIAKTLQTLPGVTSTSSFRNDLIIRGGSPAENSFYIDGIRIPSINHLSTQGASGGTISMLNLDFIRKAELISGSFPALRGNAMSSVFNFELMDGNKKKPNYRIAVGPTNLSMAANGPLGDNASYIFSLRRSYRQHILKLLGLAVYPVYNDVLLKLKFTPSNNHEVTLLGLGALDKLRINTDINGSEVQSYLIENLPVNDQWNYTVGVKNKVYSENQVWTVVASRNHLFNKASREVTTNGVSETSLRYESAEINNHLATDYLYSPGWGDIRVGLEVINRNATFDVFNQSFRETGFVKVEYLTAIDYLMYGAHFQIGAKIIPDRWNVSFGFRLDGSNYANQLNNPLNQFSPRVATTFQFSENLSLNGSLGVYYQLPSDVTLGYSENGKLANQEIIKYIQSLQYVGGIAYTTPWSSRFTLEYFNKAYSNYPFNTRENISQANEGGDFGVAGNSPVISEGNGSSQGIELMYEQKLFKNWFGTLSYTFSQSRFENSAGELVPSSWDANHIANLVIGRKLRKNWQIGANIRYQSALPYTPYDIYTSAIVPAWNINRGGIRNYDLLNSERGKSNIFIDIRIDKEWDLGWGVMTFYFDLENILADADSQQILVLDKTDNNGNPTSDAVILNPTDPFPQQRYKIKELQNAEGVTIPTFGFIIDF